MDCVQTPFSKIEVFAIKNTFNKFSKLTLVNCKNELDEYFQQINDTIESQQDHFVTPTVTFPAQPVISDEIKTFYAGVIKKNCEDIFDSLKAECFIIGLPMVDFDRLKNKAGMNTAIEMFKFLDRDWFFKMLQLTEPPTWP